MVTKKLAAKKPVLLKSAEIAERKHEELLLWLTGNLDAIVDTYFGRNEEWVKERTKEATDAFTRSCTDVIQRLEAWAAWEDATPEVRAAAQAKLAEARKIVAKPNLPPFPMAADVATVREWSSQCELYRHGYDRSGAMKRDHAGYIDCEANIRRATDASYSWASVPAEDLDDPVNRWLYEGTEEEARLGMIRDVSIRRPEIVVRNEDFVVWFRIRAKASTIGELLVEMKDLGHLNDLREPRLCVVTDNMLSSWVSMLNHEGIHVIDKTAFEAM